MIKRFMLQLQQQQQQDTLLFNAILSLEGASQPWPTNSNSCNNNNNHNKNQQIEKKQTKNQVKKLLFEKKVNEDRSSLKKLLVFRKKNI